MLRPFFPELFCGVVCVVTLPVWHFCWCRCFCHRTGSDLLFFVLSCLWTFWVSNSPRYFYFVCHLFRFIMFCKRSTFSYTACTMDTLWSCYFLHAISSEYIKHKFKKRVLSIKLRSMNYNRVNFLNILNSSVSIPFKVKKTISLIMKCTYLNNKYNTNLIVF